MTKPNSLREPLMPRFTPLQLGHSTTTLAASPVFSDSRVRTLLTTRAIGAIDSSRSKSSVGIPNDIEYLSFNLATHVNDDPVRVAQNRDILQNALPSPVLWLNQVHGTAVANNNCAINPAPTADASVCFNSQRVLAVLTADCLPVLFASVPRQKALLPTNSQNLDAGKQIEPVAIGAAHAGWRGLLNGVLEATVAQMRAGLDPATTIEATFGIAIGPTAFEVGSEVRAAFIERALNIEQERSIEAAFTRSESGAGKWYANLYELANLRLAQLGVSILGDSQRCTYSENDLFFSHRADTKRYPMQEGRQASLIWLEPSKR